MIRLDTLGICIVEKGVYQICLNKEDHTLTVGEILIAHTNDFYENVRFSEDFEGMIVFASIDILEGLVEPTHLHHCLKALKGNPIHRPSPLLWELLKSYTALLTIKTGISENRQSDDTAAIVGKAFLADMFNLVLGDMETNINKNTDTRPQTLYRQFINLLVSTPSKPHIGRKTKRNFWDGMEMCDNKVKI